jgi:hypothetical protein
MTMQNIGRTMSDAIVEWKRNQRGNTIYSREDLN